MSMQAKLHVSDQKQRSYCISVFHILATKKQVNITVFQIKEAFSHSIQNNGII